MKRSNSSPSVSRGSFRVAPSSPKAPGFTAKWKDFEKAPEEHRLLFARNVASEVQKVKEGLVEYDEMVVRAEKLEKVQSHLQMKFEMVHEQFSVCQELANNADQIKELFGVDVASRARSVSSIGLSPVAEAHVAAAVRDWQAKLDETPWMKQGRALDAEAVELKARKEAARARIDIKNRQLEIVRHLKKEGILDQCRTREEAKALIASKLAMAYIKDEVKEEDLTSDSEVQRMSALSISGSSSQSTPPATQQSPVKTEPESDQDDDFLESI